MVEKINVKPPTRINKYPRPRIYYQEEWDGRCPICKGTRYELEGKDIYLPCCGVYVYKDKPFKYTGKITY